MISLLIDTSSSRLTVAVIDEDNNKVLSYYDEIVKNDMSTKALDVISRLLDNSNVLPRDVEKIYVVNGPGSFTGVRIGVTIAKTYAWALKKKVIPISSLELLASTNTETAYNIGLIDARRGYVYAGIYNNDLTNYQMDAYISLEELLSNLPSSVSFIADDIFDNLDVIKPNIDVLKVINRHKNDEGIDPHHLNPSYLKITEAEANLKEKNDSRN